MIQVNRRAQVRGDRAGGPLDGLVNMFDLGIVLAVAFLIAALTAHGLTGVLTQKPPGKDQVVVNKQQQVVPIKPSQTTIKVKGGQPVGQVYELPDGSLVYVKK